MSQRSSFADEPSFITRLQLRGDLDWISDYHPFGACTFVDPTDLAYQLWSVRPQCGDLLLYMFRRFGFPNVEGDVDNKLAGWSLTTSIPGLFLMVTPDPSQMHFGCMMAHPLWKRAWDEVLDIQARWQKGFDHWCQERVLDPVRGNRPAMAAYLAAGEPSFADTLSRSDLICSIREALTMCLEDFSRVVPMGDGWLGPFGPVSDDNLAVDLDTGEVMKTAAPSPASGRAIPPDLLSHWETFSRVLSEISRLGAGDMEAGLLAAHSLLQSARA